MYTKLVPLVEITSVTP